MSEQLSFEDLVELAVSFLCDELGAERCLVIHPDPHEREPVVQAQEGFAPDQQAEVESMLWEWLPRGEPFLVDWQQGRSRIGCPLVLTGDHPSGLLYADHSRARFQVLHMDALLSFSERYSDALVDLGSLDWEEEPGHEPEQAPETPQIPEDEPDPAIDWSLLVVDWI